MKKFISVDSIKRDRKIKAMVNNVPLNGKYYSAFVELTDFYLLYTGFMNISCYEIRCFKDDVNGIMALEIEIYYGFGVVLLKPHDVAETSSVIRSSLNLMEEERCYRDCFFKEGIDDHFKHCKGQLISIKLSVDFIVRNDLDQTFHIKTEHVPHELIEKPQQKQNP